MLSSCTIACWSEEGHRVAFLRLLFLFVRTNVGFSLSPSSLLFLGSAQLGRENAFPLDAGS